MQKFRFELDTLLELRRRKEDEAKLKLAKKQQEVKGARGELVDMGETLKGLQQEQKLEREKKLDLVSMRHGVAYRHKLKMDMVHKGHQIAELEKETEQIRQKLVKATQQVRALELLREKRRVEWRREYDAEQQSFIDDVSQQGFIRKKSAHANDSRA